MPAGRASLQPRVFALDHHDAASSPQPEGTPVPVTHGGDGEAIEYRPGSPIKGESPVPAPRIFAAIHNILAVSDRLEVWNYLRTVSTLCERLGLDSLVLVAQWDLETDTGRSAWWRERRNPAGIGVTGDPAQNEASQTWPDGEAAAYGHVAHMVAYVWGEEWGTVWPADWPSPIEVDQRFNAPIDAGYQAERLTDLNGTWAIDPQNNYDGKLAARANRIVDAVRRSRPTGLTIP
jgi:hypothetical protein